MDKSGKESQEFLADRRKTIVEMARKRRQRELLGAATDRDENNAMGQKLNEFPAALTLVSAPPPPQG